MVNVYNFFSIILNNPIYSLLFGSGGILIIIIAIIKLINKKTSKTNNSITIQDSQKTKITGNTLNGQTITVKNSSDTEVKNNSGMTNG